MTFLQFHPSDANSTLFLAALAQSSAEDDQSRSATLEEYSHRDGMGMTDTDLWSDTARVLVAFLLLGKLGELLLVLLLGVLLLL